ncbi:MAG: chemotaxis response regulator protein-glutamate methylesterase [Nitrospinota bacterium]|nr:chemotaxis response regulator protein-glutamate methylesterase [Nitrospinota bacterium]
MSHKIRVLVVDDSALVRDTLSKGLSMDPGIEVVGSAADPFIARDKIIELKPDVLTLDVEMPRMDGVQFLKLLMPQYPIPTVMVSSLTQKGKQITFDALDAGAVDFVSKPTSNISRGLNGMMVQLRTKVKIASTANVSHWKGKRENLFKVDVKASKALAESTDKVIAIGASTGGTEAIRKVLEKFPVNAPGTVIVQHMPPGFTKLFAERLNKIVPMEVREATTGDRIIPGRALIAPGEKHMTVIRSGGHYEVVCKEGEKVSGHMPSVDVLMHSVAQHVGKNGYGIMLTGMGRDGAEGMLAMKKSGAKNVAQDEKTSVVFGMPNEAYKYGGADQLIPIDDIAHTVINMITGGKND